MLILGLKMIKNKIRKFVNYLLLQHNYSEVSSDDDSLIESNLFDSLDIAELMLFLEDEYNIYTSSSEPNVLNKLDTINLICLYIKEKS